MLLPSSVGRYCLDPASQTNYHEPKRGLWAPAARFCPVQPKFTNVDIRLALDGCSWCVDLYVSTSYDTLRGPRGS